MRSLLAAFALAVPLAAAFQTRDEPAPAAVDPAEPLRPLAGLVGHPWVADFPSGKLTDTQTWTWVYGGKFLRSVHEVRDAEGRVVYGGETIYAWDAREQVLAWWYINATGGFVEGTLEPDGDGRYRIEGLNHGPASQKPQVHGLLEIGADGWSSTSLELKDGEWRESNRLEFRPAQ
jgi:hypothetical protein